MKTVCFLLTMPPWSKEQDAKNFLTGTCCYSKPFVGTSQQNTSVWYKIKKACMYLFIQDGILHSKKKHTYVSAHVCLCMRSLKLNLWGLLLPPGPKLSPDEDLCWLCWLLAGLCHPSSVTRQRYQPCCTCALDIHHHFVFPVLHFTLEMEGVLEWTRFSLDVSVHTQPAHSSPAPASLDTHQPLVAVQLNSDSPRCVGGSVQCHLNWGLHYMNTLPSSKLQWDPSWFRRQDLDVWRGRVVIR